MTHALSVEVPVASSGRLAVTLHTLCGCCSGSQGFIHPVAPNLQRLLTLSEPSKLSEVCTNSQPVNAHSFDRTRRWQMCLSRHCDCRCWLAGAVDPVTGVRTCDKPFGLSAWIVVYSVAEAVLSQVWSIGCALSGGFDLV
jgi:hypothetical protein